MQNKSSSDDGVLGLVVSFGSWCSHLFSLCRSLHMRSTVIVLLQIGSSSKGHIRQMLLTPGSTAKVRMEVVLLFLWLFSLPKMAAEESCCDHQDQDQDQDHRLFLFFLSVGVVVVVGHHQDHQNHQDPPEDRLARTWAACYHCGASLAEVVVS
ncbi:hypothetical protein TYRP_020514 [Tyrophagus putrescentiae]|nr:hypothetical protein TYRP_020514 [Tyrophagus putrescentiae]